MLGPYKVDASFQQEIELLSEELGSDRLYPRPDLTDLNRFLKSRTINRPLTDSSSHIPGSREQVTRASFALIRELSTGVSRDFGSSVEENARFSAHNETAEGSILFLQGYASPEWLNAIGQKHRNSVELLRRHLQFEAFRSGGRDLYSSPSLPSTSVRVFHLTIPTICSRNVGISDWEPEDLQIPRKLESEAMSRYFKQIRTRAKVGDSVVRRSMLLSKEIYVLEQTVSVQIEPHGDSWNAIVWLDNGKDLSKSVEGPWNPRPGTRPWETYFFPVIVPQPLGHTSQSFDDVASHHAHFSTAYSAHQISERGPTEWRAAQNVCLLPVQYGSRLDKDLACKDALYGMSELFQFAAAAEAQFLNLISARIHQELSFVGNSNVTHNHPISLLNLKYIKTQLTLHVQHLSEIAPILKYRHVWDWPKASQCGSSESSSTTGRTAMLLAIDYEHLLHRAEDLARECETGMETLVNSSVLEESRRSYSMAVKVQRLTVIATIFIPLSFICSVWGMNFKELGSGTQPLWKYFASALPVIAFSLVVYAWDSLVRSYKRLDARREN